MTIDSCHDRGLLPHHSTTEQVNLLYEKMPPWLDAVLLPFQRDGVRFGLSHVGRCLIGDEMGVGKTLQAIALASCFEVCSLGVWKTCQRSTQLIICGSTRQQRLECGIFVEIVWFDTFGSVLAFMYNILTSCIQRLC